MSQINRLNSPSTNTTINRNKTISFEFDGQIFQGYEGDTLASALLANGQILVGRSFKYHRPRGIFTAGSEEPNALVHLRTGAHKEPNARATVAELFNGLVATSQNHRGPLKYDLMAVNDLFSNFLSAGFYYKTFMWPKAFWEKLYEPMIRHAAGLGELSKLDDPDVYDKGFLHCDILIIGAGPSGLAAALAAGQAGSRVILADEDFQMGGRLNSESYEIGGIPAADWAKNTIASLDKMDNVRLMKRTTVIGAFDHGIYSAVERKTDHLIESAGKPRQVLWKIYSKHAILSAGATERPIAFPNNDRPGVMMAAAVRSYVNRWDVTPGQAVSIFTNNDDGWRTATDLAAKSIKIAAVIDSRPIQALAQFPGAHVEMGTQVVNTTGRHGLQTITLSNGKIIDTDCLAVSGGWNPNVHLSCHHRGIPQWNKEVLAFVPSGELPPEMYVVGAANGDLSLGSALRSGYEIALALSKNLKNKQKVGGCPLAENESIANSALWFVKTETKDRSWVDFQNDVTTKDIVLAQQEGFNSVEHVKRYTTLGMATDQGKTSNIPAMAVMADNAGKTIPEIGTTIFRPPYTPVSMSTFAGRSCGKDFRPTRLTPSHHYAKKHGAVFVEVGAWMRSQWFPKTGETHWRESVDREVTQTRNSVGICDVSTLGKIDIQGKDAGEFLNRIYCNTFATLKVGMVRYGLMLREDGIAMDDGTTARLTETQYVMTTTTANAVRVFRHMEFCRQCLWPELDVHLISATEQFAQYSVAGPNARNLLEKVVDKKFSINNESFPFMACREISVCGGTPARLFRISFSGELAYEVAVPTRYGVSMMEALMEAGKEFDSVVYGTEALGVMRIEKGHAAGNELNGQTTAHNLGMGRMVSKKKDSIGNMLSERSEMVKADANRLVGFFPVDKSNTLNGGMHFVSKNNEANTQNDEGWMTSVAFSPSLGHSIGLGYLKNGHERMGEIVTAFNGLQNNTMEVEIVSAHFIDPKGERLRV
ncbi:UNVERIFIED_CONTAM: hypothetical protein GTU68_065314 [Idotea baltica]|nr:hypothetical protein [Idotea baltica]